MMTRSGACVPEVTMPRPTSESSSRLYCVAMFVNRTMVPDCTGKTAAVCAIMTLAHTIISAPDAILAPYRRRSSIAYHKLRRSTNFSAHFLNLLHLSFLGFGSSA